MKFTGSFTLFLAVLLCIASVSAAPQRGGRGRGGQRGGNRGGQQGGNRGGQQGQGQQNNGQQGQQNNGQQGQQKMGSRASKGSKGMANKAMGNGQGGGDPQTSLTLDPRVIAQGFAQDGQAQPTDGQVASLTSTNNFINFCAKTINNTPITNGQQIETGSCNPAPIGLIPSIDRMPSSKFTNPANGATIPANQQFTVNMAVKNLNTGNFVNAQENYFAAPQQLDGQGMIIGHTHLVIEQLTDLGQVQPTDPKKFAYFKGINTKANGQGVVSADVTDGLPAGAYRMCSINASSNHQPVIVPVAQHGSLDDCVYVGFNLHIIDHV
ncbi:hypothetical protein PQX77_017233 [Marasmius sp. AFHP31]|nr:hypothetical protein PQX77_017233 [Marasmius sp. AFHP31]